MRAHIWICFHEYTCISYTATFETRNIQDVISSSKQLLPFGNDAVEIKKQQRQQHTITVSDIWKFIQHISNYIKKLPNSNGEQVQVQDAKKIKILSFSLKAERGKIKDAHKILVFIRAKKKSACI